MAEAVRLHLLDSQRHLILRAGSSIFDPGYPIQHHFIELEGASSCGCHDEDLSLYMETCIHIV